MLNLIHLRTVYFLNLLKELSHYQKKNQKEDLDWFTFSTRHQCKPQKFSGTREVNVPIQNIADPLEIFKLYFTPELIHETNLYAEKVIVEKSKKKELRKYSSYHR